jgi:hypothetical protein
LRVGEGTPRSGGPVIAARPRPDRASSRRKEVRRVLLAPEHRNLQQVEGGVTGFVQENAAEVVLSADGRFLY